MKITNRTAYFKSSSDNYAKEISGRKCNTVRKITPSESAEYGLVVEESGLAYYMGFNYLNMLTHIEITNADDPDDYFRRELSDVTVYNGMYIFSWKPPKR